MFAEAFSWGAQYIFSLVAASNPQIGQPVLDFLDKLAFGIAPPMPGINGRPG